MLGAFMSVAIQACADDDQTVIEEPNSSNNGGDNEENNESSSNNSSAGNETPRCNCAWSAQRMTSVTYYDEKGEISSKTTCSYDSHGRVAKTETLSYLYNNTGQRFLAMVNSTTYTYSGNTQIGIQKIISYNENGGIQTSSTIKIESCLYEE